MNKRVWLLNLALLALIGSLGWLLRAKWREGNAQERAFLQQAPHIRALMTPPAPPLLAQVTPAEYNDVAQKMLFARDRNPNVVVAPPPPPPPPPPMPALPVYFGQMAIGEPVVLLSPTPNGEQKSYHKGEDVGKFKLVAFDTETITFEWDGKDVVRKFSELVPKDTAPAQAAATLPTGPPPQSQGTKTSIIDLAPPAPQQSTKPPTVGSDAGGGFRGCVAGDNSPAGTVVDGYTKVVTQTLMGQQCFWKR